MTTSNNDSEYDLDGTLPMILEYVVVYDEDRGRHLIRLWQCQTCDHVHCDPGDLGSPS